MTSPSIPDLARAAIRLLDDYAVAREKGLALAAKGEAAGRLETRELLDRIGLFLQELSERLEDAGENGWGVWHQRGFWAAIAQIDADAWALELAALAQGYEGARSTEPEVARG